MLLMTCWPDCRIEQRRPAQSSALGGVFGGEAIRKDYKILDTASLSMAGSDIAETGFLDGTIGLTFVFAIATGGRFRRFSKRNRGQRGLDIRNACKSGFHKFQSSRMTQRSAGGSQIDRTSQPYGGKIITNDFNLNKVAQLRALRC
jgi:uncharacterized protein YacL